MARTCDGVWHSHDLVTVAHADADQTTVGIVDRRDRFEDVARAPVCTPA